MQFKDAIKMKRFQSDYHMAILNIWYTGNWLRDISTPIFKKEGITSQQYNVMRILKGRHPNACAAGDIKEVMLDKSPDMTRLLDRLLDKKFIEREVCESNRRKLDIQISKSGLKLLDRMEPVLKDHHERNSDNLSESEAKQLSELLDKIRKNEVSN